MPIYARKFPFVLSLLLSAAFVPTRAEAQQGYEFGIRFNPVNFRPVNFNGFSFQQPSYRGLNTQPIQFERITFPAFNSRSVRQAASEPPASPATAEPQFGESNYRLYQRLRLQVARGEPTAGLHSRLDEPGRSRLTLNVPAQGVKAEVAIAGRLSADAAQSVHLTHSIQSTASVQNSHNSLYSHPVQYTASSATLHSSARRRLVAARLSARNPRSIAQRLTTQVAATAPSTALANRAVERFRLGELTGREIR